MRAIKARPDSDWVYGFAVYFTDGTVKVYTASCADRLTIYRDSLKAFGMKGLRGVSRISPRATHEELERMAIDNPDSRGMWRFDGIVPIP